MRPLFANAYGTGLGYVNMLFVMFYWENFVGGDEWRVEIVVLKNKRKSNKSNTSVN